MNTSWWALVRSLVDDFRRGSAYYCHMPVVVLCGLAVAAVGFVFAILGAGLAVPVLMILGLAYALSVAPVIWAMNAGELLREGERIEREALSFLCVDDLRRINPVADLSDAEEPN